MTLIDQYKNMNRNIDELLDSDRINKDRLSQWEYHCKLMNNMKKPSKETKFDRIKP